MGGVDSVAVEHLLRLRPRLVPRIWGGRRLVERFGGSISEPVGEAWMVYDENEVLDGPYAGRPLKEVLAELGEAFLGPRSVSRYGLELPLLVKLLETTKWLSVQVHPDDDYARAVEAHTGFRGKSEAWVILDAGPGAEIVYGVNRPVTRDELLEAARDGTILDLLNFVPVKSGDVIYVPAGTIHALGPGLFVYEVQQRSDLTYRLYDFGRGRELHLDKALEVARLEPQTLEKRSLSHGIFLRTPFFQLALREGSVAAPEDSFLTVTDPWGKDPGEVLAAGARVRFSSGPRITAGL